MQELANQLAGGRVPKAAPRRRGSRWPTAPGRQAGLEGHGGHRAGMAVHGLANWLVGGLIPEPRHAVVAPAGQQDLAWICPPEPAALFGQLAKGHRGHRAGMAAQRLANWLSGGRVPEPHHAVAGPDSHSTCPSGKKPKATAVTALVWTNSSRRARPVSGSQSRTMPS